MLHTIGNRQFEAEDFDYSAVSTGLKEPQEERDLDDPFAQWWNNQPPVRANENYRWVDGEAVHVSAGRVIWRMAQAAVIFQGASSLFCPVKFIAEKLLRVLYWIDQGERHQAKAIRLGAVLFFLLPDKSQSDIATKLHVGKAAVSQACCQFKKDFRLDEILAGIPGMRGEAAIEKFSTICKQRHQQRHQSETSD